MQVHELHSTPTPLLTVKNISLLEKAFKYLSHKMAISLYLIEKKSSIQRYLKILLVIWKG